SEMATASETMDRPLPRGRGPGPVSRIGGAVLDILQIIGEAGFVLVRTLARIRLSGRTWTRIMARMGASGTDTLPLAFFVSVFVGMLPVGKAAEQLPEYPQDILDSLVGLAMTKELGPVIMAFLIAGRAGSAIAAELGSMTVYDEINALRTMDIDPIEFLSVP